MAIKWRHSDSYSTYFITFTCYKWLSLFEAVNGYDLVYKWFDYLKARNIYTIAFVIMPNHVHAIFYFPEAGFDLNKIIGNGKRLIAYDIIKRLKNTGNETLLEQLNNAVSMRESKKGQLHKVFEASFDAKGIYSEKFFFQKLHYVHHNPVQDKWCLGEKYTDYYHSSASFYEDGIVKAYEPFDFRIM